jgi:hypothetical protein
MVDSLYEYCVGHCPPSGIYLSLLILRAMFLFYFKYNEICLCNGKQSS